MTLTRCAALTLALTLTLTRCAALTLALTLTLTRCAAVLLFACLDHLQAAPEAVYGLVCGAATPLPALLLLLVPDQAPP